VLPSLSYDITLQPVGSDQPIPRGVRLLSAQTDPVLEGFNPHVTTIITEETYAAQQEDPALGLVGEWTPEQLYTYQHLEREVQEETDPVIRDLLSIAPAQFKASGDEFGELRTYRQLVFEVTYVAPSNATTAQLGDTVPPAIDDISITFGAGAGATVLANTQPLKVIVDVSDQGTTPAGMQVSLTYTIDGLSWQRASMTYNAAADQFEIIVTPPSLSLFQAIIEARDAAGNVTTETAKGEFVALEELFLPLIAR
jgi:hypothetical protein